MPRATYFSIDIECSGPVPAHYDMISLGAVRVIETGEGHAIGEPWYVEIRPESDRFVPSAMAVNGLDWEHLRAHGTPRREAILALTAWVEEQTLEGTTPVFVGHNAPFDWSFVNWAYHDEGLPNPFGYKALCTKAMATGALGIHWLDSNKEFLAERFDLPEVETAKVHRADYDAWYQAWILVRLLELA